MQELLREYPPARLLKILDLYHWEIKDFIIVPDLVIVSKQNWISLEYFQSFIQAIVLKEEVLSLVFVRLIIILVELLLLEYFTDIRIHQKYCHCLDGAEDFCQLIMIPYAQLIFKSKTKQYHHHFSQLLLTQLFMYRLIQFLVH